MTTRPDANRRQTDVRTAGSKRATSARPPRTEDWREQVLARVRRLITQAVPDAVEEIKWKRPSNGMAGVPVWSTPAHNSGTRKLPQGIICTGETYKNAVKLTFARGASLADPAGLFNTGRDGRTRRAINIHEGDSIDARAFKSLVRAAAALNRQPRDPSGVHTAPRKPGKQARPRLLSGGNPQIAKGLGDAPIRAYIAAMSGGGPGWKRRVGERIDAIIEREVPSVRKAVKWNSPLYGAASAEASEGPVGEWFLGVHCMSRYVKVAFFRGASLKPMPPIASKQKHVRYFHIHEADAGRFDEKQFADWVRQASRIPGERM